MLFFSPVGGRLFDNYGPRVPMAIGTAMHIFGLMMLSASREYYQIMLSQSVCSGIGSSLVFSPAVTAVRSSLGTNKHNSFHTPCTYISLRALPIRVTNRSGLTAG